MVGLGVVEIAVVVVAIALLSSEGGRRVLGKLALAALILVPLGLVVAGLWGSSRAHRVVQATDTEVHPGGDMRQLVYAPPNVKLPVLPQPAAVPPAPGPPASHVHVGELATWLKLAILLAPIAVVLIAFLLVRRQPQPSAGERGGHGFAWLGFGAAALALLGFLAVGSVRRDGTVRTGEQPEVASVPMPSSPDRVAIDQQWERLTAPRIPLDWSPPSMKQPTGVWKFNADRQRQLNSAETATHELAETQTELAAAASALESASRQMALTASEGWMTTAMKALVNVSSKKSHPAKVYSVAEARAEADALAAVNAAQATLKASATESARLAELSHPRSPAPLRRPSATPSLHKVKPSWVDHPPGLVGKVRHVVVSAGPYQTIDECYRDLENQMRVAVSQRISELASAATGSQVASPPLQSLRIGTDHVLREMCIDEYEEVIDASFGEMKRAYGLMAFTEAQDNWLLDRWKDYARRDRLAALAMWSGLTVGGVALVYGLLKVDTWTRGYYSKRLFIGVPAAIIALLALLAIENIR